MQLETVKTIEQVKAGLNIIKDDREAVELIIRNNQIEGIRIHGLHLGVSSYNFSIAVEVPFRSVSWYLASAKAPGFGEMIEYFETWDAAKNWLDAFDSQSSELIGPQAVTVLIDEKGNFVSPKE
jgi:hypothetical protein